MDSLKDLLKNKANRLDLGNRLDDLKLAQGVLDRHFGSNAKAVKLDRGKLFIKASSSSAASDIRLNQVAVLDELGRILKSSPEKLVIRQ